MKTLNGLLVIVKEKYKNTVYYHSDAFVYCDECKSVNIFNLDTEYSKKELYNDLIDINENDERLKLKRFCCESTIGGRMKLINMP